MKFTPLTVDLARDGIFPNLRIVGDATTKPLDFRTRMKYKKNVKSVITFKKLDNNDMQLF